MCSLPVCTGVTLALQLEEAARLASHFAHLVDFYWLSWRPETCWSVDLLEKPGNIFDVPSETEALAFDIQCFGFLILSVVAFLFQVDTLLYIHNCSTPWMGVQLTFLFISCLLATTYHCFV